MRVLRPSTTPSLSIIFSVLLTSGLMCFGLSAYGFAAEIAELRNGFSIPHRSHEFRDGCVRLYIDESKKSFIDLPADQIQRFSTQPDPPPVAETKPQQQASAAGESSTAQSASNTFLDRGKSTQQIVREASESHGVDSDFIDSVIKHESAGNAHAVSRAGARGLMQLMPGTAAKLGVDDSFSPEQNVNGGARYLRELLERYNGDAVKALAAYNAGPGAVDRYRGVPPYRETRVYVQRIVRDYNRRKQSAAKAHVKVVRGTAAKAAPQDAEARAGKTVFVAKANAGIARGMATY